MVSFRNESEMRQMAALLVPMLDGFCPEAVVFLHRGGHIPGQVIAGNYGIPLIKLDIRYPISRRLERLPSFLRALLWPSKEIMYRFGTPFLSEIPTLPSGEARIVLVDDSASSGKTIKQALVLMEDSGIPRESIRVAVLRCGKRARPLVDYFIEKDRISFLKE